VVDSGGGIHRLFLGINGNPVAAETLDCALRGMVAVRLRPCPARADAGFMADTTQPPFRQGPNRVRICATDYAPDTAAGRDCVTRRVRVDNACPVSEVGTGRTVRFHVRRSGHGPFGYRSTPLLVGRVLDSSGRGVLGAEVCVAARIGVAGVPERILATPMTGPGGRFKVRIPPGPTRRLRAAHWASTTTVAEDFRTLRVRARPRLTLAPGGVLRNGERVRFRVELPGPRAAGRHIALKVRANGRWLPLRRGRTNRRGVWTGGYRFRATSGRQTYKFSAFAPKQRGYPYATGRSKSKRQTVLG
jgi:hypothetical protein